MSGRLFLHIGPPKTATTSLQVALEGLAHPRYRFLGTLQPRARNADSPAQRVYRAVMQDSAGPVVSELRDLVGTGAVVVLSEEMLPLQQSGLATGEKIARLGRILSGIPTTVLITLRDPVEALPSLFQELRPGLPLALQLSFARFCTDGLTECYDYARLADHLAGAGLADLRWIDFRRIAAGCLTTADLFGGHDLWTATPLSLERLNAGAAAGSGARRVDRTSLRAIGRSGLVRGAIDRLGLRGTALVRWAASISERIKLGPESYDRLKVPARRAEPLRDGYRAMLERMQAQGPAAQDRALGG